MGGFMHKHENVKKKRKGKTCFFCLYCNSSFCFRASDRFFLAAQHPADTCPESLLCYCASFFLSFSFFPSFLFFFLNHSFCVVSARSWYHSFACNHNSLIRFIDFKIKIIKTISTDRKSVV